MRNVMPRKIPESGYKRVAMLSAMGVTVILLSGCAATKAGGIDAGCVSYSEARLDMPPAETVPGGPWGPWIADLDDRMTGTCM